MCEAQVVEGMAFVAHDQPSEIAEPGEKSRDLPAPAITPQRAPILRLATHAPPPVRGDHLDVPLRHSPVQSIRIVGAVANQASWQLANEAGNETLCEIQATAFLEVRR